MKVNVYVDGFNLYYRALKGTPHRWLHLYALSRRLLRPDDQVNRIRYFTALVSPRPDNPHQLVRQQTYIRALKTIPNLSVHYGSFLTNIKRMRVVNPPPDCPNTVEVVDTEEKGSDVNLATYLLIDAFDGDFDLAIILSNDSDLVLPIRMVRSRFGLPVGVWNPSKRSGGQLRQVASFHKGIRESALRESQFPPTLRDTQGTITKPAGW